MNEFVTPDGEILELAKSPYQVACTALVAFKLATMETVAADPRLAKAPCLSAMVVYLSFLKVDKETLKPKAVYASNLKLMAKGGIKTKVTAGTARRLLVLNGYLVATGTSTRDGCVKFHAANPHLDRVRMHVVEAEEYYGRKDAERKEQDRRRGAIKRQGVIVTDTPFRARGDSNYTDRVIVTDTKYLRGNLRDSCSEDSNGSLEDNPSFISDPTIPFDVPSSEEEIDEILAVAGTVHPTILKQLRKMLLARELTPALLTADFGGRDDRTA